MVVVQSRSDLHHQGITLTVEGNVSLQLSAKSVGLFEAFYSSLKVSVIFVCFFLSLKKYFVRITQYCGFQNYVCVFL